MHMKKVRTTINLNEDVVIKAKSMGINISATAERGIIDYIKELESIGENNTNSVNNDTIDDNKSSAIHKERRGRDLNSRSPDGEPALKAGALGRTLLPRL